jgi:hypothetical protein
MNTMLILRGNPGNYPNEDGKDINYSRGALHEGAALQYAKLNNLTGKVLDVVGWASEDSKQTKMALDEFRRDKAVAAFYGFSGGGYNVKHILDKLTADECGRVSLVVVLGAPGNLPALYSASKYGDKAHWDLVYKLDPPDSKGGHMFGPEELLKEMEEKVRKGRVHFSPRRVRGHH